MTFVREHFGIQFRILGPSLVVIYWFLHKVLNSSSRRTFAGLKVAQVMWAVEVAPLT